MIRLLNNIHFQIGLALLCATLFITHPAYANEKEVTYHIDISNPTHHIARVKANFPPSDSAQLEVMMPVWRPGRYKIMDLSGGMLHFKASDESGKPLKATKIDKTTWHIEQAQAKSIHVEYELYANQLNLRTRHIDETHAFLDLVSVLVYSEPLRNLPVHVSLTVPKLWQSRSGMEKGKTAHSFVAANYDILVDSPIETGIHTFNSFKVDGKTHELVIWGEGNQDEKKMIADLEKIAAASGKIWGSYPFERYVWMLHLNDVADSGTEHINSTIMQLLRFSFSPREDYLDFLSLAAHEFIHT